MRILFFEKQRRNDVTLKMLIYSTLKEIRRALNAFHIFFYTSEFIENNCLKH